MKSHASTASGPPRRAPSRGVTLLELMIALALLVGVTAITLPSVLGELDRRAYEGAVQTVTNQLLLARAHAQTTGRAVEVSYRTEASHVVARFFDLARDLRGDDDPPRSAAEHAALRRGAGGVSDRNPDEAGTIHERWALVVLREGVTISREPPPDPEAPFGADADAFVADDAAALLAPAPEAIRLAVFLSDGSTLLGEPVWIVGDARRTGMLRINEWTGLPAFEPRVPGAIAAGGDDDAYDDDAYDDDAYDDEDFDEPEMDPADRRGDTDRRSAESRDDRTPTTSPSTASDEDDEDEDDDRGGS